MYALPPELLPVARAVGPELCALVDDLGFDYRNETGIEVFYNAAVTPWFRLSGDVQVIWPSSIDDTAVFLGLRGQVIAF